MRRRKQMQALEEPQVNLTPLIDVVFVILIIFIVIAPILEMQEIALADAPSGEAAKSVSVQKMGPISIHILKNNHVKLNQQLISIEELAHRLRLEKQKHPSECPQLFCDQGAHFGTYQLVKNAAELVGFDQIEIVLQPH